MAELNIELFKKVRERIVAIPESYSQDDWLRPRQSSPCGYAACLAGEAIICNAPTVEQGIAELRRLKEQDQYTAVPERAAALLGLSGSWGDFIEHDANEPALAGETLIFDSDADYWPEPFRSDFRDGEEAYAAVEYLDWIIANRRIFPDDKHPGPRT